MYVLYARRHGCTPRGGGHRFLISKQLLGKVTLDFTSVPSSGFRVCVSCCINLSLLFTPLYSNVMVKPRCVGRKGKRRNRHGHMDPCQVLGASYIMYMCTT